MKAVKLFSVLCLFMAFSTIAQAQSKKEELVKDWERAKAYTKEYLDAMPETSYALKPTPEMRSFAGQFLHLSDGNYGFIAAAFGVKSPVGPGELEKASDQSKAAVTKAVLESYDFVISNIRKATPEQFKGNIKLFGRFELSKEDAVNKSFEHQTHHRGQTTVYLRLAGVKPPAEKLF